MTRGSHPGAASELLSTLYEQLRPLNRPRRVAPRDFQNCTCTDKDPGPGALQNLYK